MHFSIPDTSECTDKSGTYSVFNLHINGAYHCSVRYRQFHSFHEQLKKEFGVNVLPSFPPKRLLSLSPGQLEERRTSVERYIQILSQNPQISSSDTFNKFLLQAQQQSLQETSESVCLCVHLVQGQEVNLEIASTDQTETVLEAVASEIQLPDDLVYYFGLYLVHMEDDDDYTIVRKLQEFESPYISLKAANQSSPHRICLRKSYWDPVYDEDLMNDRVATNLLYLQACSDVARRWVLAADEQHRQLESLRLKGSKKEYLQFVRTLKYYGYVQFHVCYVDYPHPECRTVISAGNKELNMRIEVDKDVVKEVSFRVTRMRCWRITTTLPESGEDSEESQLELAFEYLIARDTMQWITILSNQAIVISMCLQGMVDELVMKKDGRRVKKPQDRRRTLSSSSQKSRPNSIQSANASSSPTDVTNGVVTVQKKTILQKSPCTENDLPARLISSHSQTVKALMSENYAFEGIGDDDL